ncbi:hypothetical protein PSEMO_23780 [Pseudomonas putida]|uniref:Uncharacterized protein n=1 Tax=Pseudomonas putida TaxID=303 RepID=A0A1Q9R5Q3_PSEPU|nr:hypothetical protein PSEMO_23780 [Pseudomonas putida]
MNVIGIVLDPLRFALHPEPWPVQRAAVVRSPVLQMHVQAVEGQCRRCLLGIFKRRGLDAMAHQDEAGRAGRFELGLGEGRVAGGRGRGGDAIGDHFAIGHAQHPGLVEHARGAVVEMHAAMPGAMHTDGIETVGGLAQVSQLLEHVGTVAEGMAPVLRQQFGRRLGVRFERHWPRRQLWALRYGRWRRQRVTLAEQVLG